VGSSPSAPISISSVFPLGDPRHSYPELGGGRKRGYFNGILNPIKIEGQRKAKTVELAAC